MQRIGFSPERGHRLRTFHSILDRMVEKVSLRKGNAKKPAQKYQNKAAFRHNKNSKLTRVIEALPVVGLCQHCTDIMIWRKTYRKYKPLTVPKKCLGCQEKTVKDAYHVLCHGCAGKRNVCAKCQQEKNVVTPASNAALDEEKLRLKSMLAEMPERHKRSVLRKMDKAGAETLAELEAFIEKQMASSSLSDSESDSSDDGEEEEDQEDEEE